MNYCDLVEFAELVISGHNFTSGLLTKIQRSILLKTGDGYRYNLPRIAEDSNNRRYMVY